MDSSASEQLELNDDELLTLVELMHVVVEVDKDTSPEESDQVALIAEQVGQERFWEAVSQTLGKDFLVASSSARVTRRSAQQYILDLLEELSESDGLEDDEAAVLAAVRAAWSIAD